MTEMANREGVTMRKEVVIVELKSTQEADKAVIEVDEVVRESTAALDAGKVRPSASGLVRCASELVRDGTKAEHLW